MFELLKQKEQVRNKLLDRYYVDGIKASLDEYTFAKTLNYYIELGTIEQVSFQPEKIILLPKFDGIKKWRDNIYTPDFAFIRSKDKQKFIIEIKGFNGHGAVTGYNNLRHKLADMYYQKTDNKYMVLKWRGKVREGTKGFYNHYQPQKLQIKNANKLLELEFFNMFGFNDV